ncbi:hypothetical protein CMI37_30995 [Candidatus Pacearchaeota archaeon]|nr:hypothetical protein [Candidatus Pacearchaeota archaeon]
MDWNDIGKGDKQSQNPPELNEHDIFSYNWYHENCNQFTKEFGLLPHLFDNLLFKRDEKEIFFVKCNMIYQYRIRQSIEGLNKEKNA